MKSLLEHFIRSLIDWLFRRRGPALIVMRIGLTSLVLAFGAGWALDISLPFQDDQVAIGLNSSGGTPTIIAYLAALVGVSLLGGGFVWEVLRYRVEQNRSSRKKVIVIEVRGLRDGGGSPLSAAIPETVQGTLECMLVDLRQRVKDGEIVSPHVALEILASLPSDLRRREDGLNRGDITLVYGGLASVPFSFLSGVLIDDERSVILLDWNRHEEAWRALDGSDDGMRFEVVESPRVPKSQSEVALAVSVSYGINTNDIRALVDNIPIVELRLEGGSPDAHWSEDKQRALGKQFLEIVGELATRGIQRIHFRLAKLPQQPRVRSPDSDRTVGGRHSHWYAAKEGASVRDVPGE